MEGARQILAILQAAGYQAYIIGGAVRDLLMGKEPHDFDIVTQARPEQVQAVMGRAGLKTTDLVGKSFGVVIVSVGQQKYEVATYRRERYGVDSHRPEVVEYADTLEDDVQRRDFTVNGMAMDLDGHIIDLVGGQKDLQAKRLRTIGNPLARFREDALRLFRACRFVAKLDFLPTKDLQAAMPLAFDRVRGLSLERVRNELDALLLQPAAAKGLDLLVQSKLGNCQCSHNQHGSKEYIDILPELCHLVDLPQEKLFHEYDGWMHTLVTVAHTPADLTLRWAALLHDVGKGLPNVRGFHKGRITDRGHDIEGARLATSLLHRLGYPKAFVERVTWLVHQHMKFHYYVGTLEANPNKWVRKEARSGLFRYSRNLSEAMIQLSQLCAADIMGCGKAQADPTGTLEFGRCMAELALDMPIHTRDLHYDTRLIQEAGDAVGPMLKSLLEAVQNGRVRNEADALLDALRRKQARARQRNIL